MPKWIFLKRVPDILSSFWNRFLVKQFVLNKDFYKVIYRDIAYLFLIFTDHVNEKMSASFSDGSPVTSVGTVLGPAINRGFKAGHWEDFIAVERCNVLCYS